MMLICQLAAAFLMAASAASLSRWLMANTTSLSLLTRRSAFSKMGNSRLQGPHHEAQKVRITTLPRWLLRVTSSPVTRLRTLKSGATDPTTGPEGTSGEPKALAENISPKRQNNRFIRTPCVGGRPQSYITYPFLETTLQRLPISISSSSEPELALETVTNAVR